MLAVLNTQLELTVCQLIRLIVALASGVEWPVLFARTPRCSPVEQAFPGSHSAGVCVCQARPGEGLFLCGREVASCAASG